MTALKNYVAAGLGVALIPKSIVSPPPPGTIVRFIDDDPISVTFGILCKTAAFPLKQADAKLYQYLKQELWRTVKNLPGRCRKVFDYENDEIWK